MAPAAFPARGATGCLPVPYNETFASACSVRAADSLAGDSILRNRPLLSGFGALLIALAPFPGFRPNHETKTRKPSPSPIEPVAVRDRPHPEYDPLGLRFGAFRAQWLARSRCCEH